MARNAPIFLRFAIVVFSLMTAIAVYLFARSYPPELLAPFQSTNPDLARHIAIFGSAPSFFYTLALGLLIGACASNVTAARVHCLAWVGLASCLELSQYPGVSMLISTWLYDISAGPIWDIIGPYWSRGVFDPVDLLATLIGGSIASILLDHLPEENSGANTS